MKDRTQLIFKIYILLNLFVWMFPNFNSTDVIGSQWLYISMLNILGLIMIYRLKGVENIHSTLKNPIISCFTLLGLWATMSFLYASNDSEVFIESVRLFTLILLLINLSYALYIIKHRMRFISTILVIYLGIETLFVLIPTYNIHGTFVGLARNQIFKGIAANINITAFSILLKVPFAILHLKNKGPKLLKVVISLLLIFSFFTISLLATRGAILGSFIIVTISTVFSLVFLKSRKNLINVGILIFSLLTPFFFNQIFQERYLFLILNPYSLKYW